MTEPHPPTVTHRLNDRVRLVLAVVPAVILLLDLPTLLASAGRYRPYWLESAGYCGLVAVTAVGGWLVVRHRPWGRLRWPLVAAALIATAAATAAMGPADVFGTAHWSWDIFGWWAVLLLLDRPLSILLMVIAVHLVVSVNQLVPSGGADRPTVVGMSISAAALGGLPVVAWLVGASARRNAARAAATAAALEYIRTAEQVAIEIHRDRQARYAEVSATAGPLLAALAEGTADPGDPVVRRTFFIEATRLRQQFADADASDEPLVHQLAVCADTAARRGIAVSIAARGARPPLRPTVRAAMTDTVVHALAAAHSTARVTVVSMAGVVTVMVVADLADEDPAGPPEPSAAADGVTVTWEARGGSLWAEAAWAEAPVGSPMPPGVS